MTSVQKTFLLVVLSLFLIFNAVTFFVVLVIIGISLEVLGNNWIAILIAEVFLLVTGITLALFSAYKIKQALLKISDAIKKLASGSWNIAENLPLEGSKQPSEIELLAVSTHDLSKNLSTQLQIKLKEQEEKNKSKLAKSFQTMLLPQNISSIPGLDISAGLVSSPESAGDLYDIFSINNKTFMYALDVTGKGMSSVAKAAYIHYFVHANEEQIVPTKVLVEINRILRKKEQTESYAALILGIYDHLTKKFSISNAGYPKSIIFDAEAKKTKVLAKSAPALGMFDRIDQYLTEEEVSLNVNDVLVIYSDGLVEAKRNDNEAYGLPRFKRAINEYSDLPSAISIRNALLADVKEFIGPNVQTDDWTLIVIKRP